MDFINLSKLELISIAITIHKNEDYKKKIEQLTDRKKIFKHLIRITHYKENEYNKEWSKEGYHFVINLFNRILEKDEKMIFLKKRVFQKEYDIIKNN